MTAPTWLRPLVCRWRGHQYLFAGVGSAYGMHVRVYQCERCEGKIWESKGNRPWRSPKPWSAK